MAPEKQTSQLQQSGLAAVSVARTAELLTKARGWPISEEMIRADIEAGAPVNSDGTLNLIYYAAWLLKEMGRGK